MFERCIYFNTNALARKLNARWEKAFSRFDLPPSHGYLLRLVLEYPQLSQREIAKELRLDKSTVARFVGKLEDKGLLRRTKPDKDRRENIVQPTSKALAMQDELASLGDELYASMCEVIGKRKVKKFVSSIREIGDQLSPHVTSVIE